MNYKKITRKTYDLIAHDYAKRDKNMKVDEAIEVIKDLKQFSTFLPKRAKILDIGSGGGRDSRFLFKEGFEVTGIDFSGLMIRNAKHIEPRIFYKTMDFEKLRFKINEFDGVWANASLHHIPKRNLGRVLGKIHQILKPKGVFFIKVKQGRGDGIRENFKFGRTIKRHFSFYQTQELKNLLRGAGFKIILLKVTNKKEWIDAFAQKGKSSRFN